ncbi:MAG: Hsp20/alpha crystallin family protein [Promethearchaeota archaeon]
MTEVIEKPTTSVIPEPKKPEIKYRICPTNYFNYNPKTKEWNLEIHIPGVDKEKISLKVLSNQIFFEAQRENTAIYTLSRYFPWKIEVDSVKGSYENGLLNLTGILADPMKNAVALSIE